MRGIMQVKTLFLEKKQGVFIRVGGGGGEVLDKYENATGVMQIAMTSICVITRIFRQSVQSSR